MTPQPDRLVLLRAIVAHPDEDTPRLAFADWLDEHGTADADHARAEFLRVACKLKPKVRITKDEQNWLAEHWQRLLPTASARLGTSGDHGWSGRNLRLWGSVGPMAVVSVDLEFWRGFVRRVSWGGGFERLACEIAADEPLARHEFSRGIPLRSWPLADGRTRAGVAPEWCGGRGVWDRVAGYDSAVDTPERARKVFDQPPGPKAWEELERRVRGAISAAMTAEARSHAGWPEDLPTLG